MGKAVEGFPALGLALALLTGLAGGCIGGADSESDPEGDSTTNAALGTGVVEGAVTSDLFEPLGQATVTLIQLHLSVDAPGGTYRFEGLPDGLFTFVALATGYFEQVQSVKVEQNTTIKMDFRLAPLPKQEPWLEEYPVVGFISLSASWDVAPGGDCINDLSSLSGSAKSCGGTRFNSVCVALNVCAGERTVNGEIEINASADVGTVILELAWVPKGPLGTNLQLDLLAPCTARGGGGAVLDPEGDPCYFPADGTTSPLYIRVDNTTLEERNINGENRTGDWAARVFSGSGSLGTWDSLSADIGLAWQQDFTYYVSMWHKQYAPEDYSSVSNS